MAADSSKNTCTMPAASPKPSWNQALGARQPRRKQAFQRCANYGISDAVLGSLPSPRGTAPRGDKYKPVPPWMGMLVAMAPAGHRDKYLLAHLYSWAAGLLGHLRVRTDAEFRGTCCACSQSWKLIRKPFEPDVIGSTNLNR